MLQQFLPGAISMGFMVAGLMFLKFWRRTHEQLFLAFSGAFWLLGIQQAWLALTNIPVEERSPLYLVRLLAFVLIIAAFWLSNRQRRKG
jgi:hypothetical protein